MVEFFINNWENILQYVLIAMAYFFAFLFRNSANAKGNFLAGVFKERTAKVDTYEKRIERLEKTMEALLEEREDG